MYLQFEVDAYRMANPEMDEFILSQKVSLNVEDKFTETGRLKAKQPRFLKVCRTCGYEIPCTGICDYCC